MEPLSPICAVIPTFNERENVEALVSAIEEAKISNLNILFVDDSSPDGTAEVVKTIAASKPWVSLLLREGRRGIGSAYQEGFKSAIADKKAKIVVEMDADLQHPASALPALVRAVNDGADVAIGSRYIPGGGISGWSRFRRLTSKGANVYSRFMLGLKVRDATSGFRAYKSEVALEISSAKLPVKGFEFQVAILHLLKDHAKIVEVPYVFVARTAGKSKLKLSDMVRFFFSVAKISVVG